MEILITLGITIFFLMLGLIVGGMKERNHLASLDLREQQNANMLVCQIKSFPDHKSAKLAPTLLVAETVIATDYLKSFLAGLRNFFGGEVKSYQSLLVRARREALPSFSQRCDEHWTARAIVWCANA